MRRALFAFALCLFPVARRANAQRPRATLADSNIVAEGVYHYLLDSIALSLQMRQKALGVIHQTIRAQYSSTVAGTLEERRKHADSLVAQRDSALAQLIPSRADKALFWKRSVAHKAGQPQPLRGKPFH